MELLEIIILVYGKQKEHEHDLGGNNLHSFGWGFNFY